MDSYFWFSILVATNSLLVLSLAVNVSRLRIKHKVSFGDGGNNSLMAAIRTHGNALEQIPIFAIMLLTLTYLEASTGLLAILVIGFTLSRFFHAYGMLYQVFVARRIGAGFTYIFQFVVAILILLHLLS